jgi:4-aminobutyrate aminotransferase-like enzyme
LIVLAERIAATMPPDTGMDTVMLVNSGSEANELALRLARAHTRRRDVIVLEGAYHGNTTTLVDISPYKFNGPGGEGAPPWVHVLPLPDAYRGKYRRDDPRAGEKYAEYARHVRNPGAFIAESAPSVAGQVMLPDRYLASVYAIVRGAGGVCIADEVQTAYGRMGTHFYAFEAQRVVPDIVVLGKPIGNGYPIGAVVTTAEIAASFDNGMEFFSTFGGSTVACAVGVEVLDVVEAERLQAHAHDVGTELLARLHGAIGDHPLVGDIRGSGLFLGVELVKDRQTLEPATTEAADVVNRMRERGVLIGTEGASANVLKIRPPMPFGSADAALLCDTLAASLG